MLTPVYEGKPKDRSLPAYYNMGKVSNLTLKRNKTIWEGKRTCRPHRGSQKKYNENCQTLSRTGFCVTLRGDNMSPLLLFHRHKIQATSTVCMTVYEAQIGSKKLKQVSNIK